MSGMEKRGSTLDRYPSLSVLDRKRVKLQIFGWGRGDLGQLGNNAQDNVLAPTRIEAFGVKDVVHLAASLYNSGAVTDDGEVYMMGNNDYGQLGKKARTSRPMPERVEALDLYQIVHFALGLQHSLAVTEEGRLVSWGSGEFGQLGYGTIEVEHPIPKLVKAEGDVHFIHVVLASNGQVYTCGEGQYGALGSGSSANSAQLYMVPGLFSCGVVQVACGEHHTVALSIDGRLFSWGRGKYGQLGLGHQNTVYLPHLVEINGIKGRQVACGADHVLLAGTRGEMFSWGRGTWGQTGLATMEDQLVPVKVQELEHEYISQVSAGRGHSLAVARRGAVYAFGNGEQGQLGLGAVKNVSTPTEVTELPSLRLLYVLSAGDHSFAVFDESPVEESAMSLQPVLDFKHGRGLRATVLPTFSSLLQAIKGSDDDHGEAVASLKAAIDDIFSSPGYCIKRFSSPGERPDETCLHLHIDTITRTYEGILKHAAELQSPALLLGLGSASIQAMNGMLSGLSTAIKEEKDRDKVASEWLRCLIILWLNPLFGEIQGQGILQVEKLAEIVSTLPPASLQLLEKWLGGLRTELFGGRIMGGIQKCISNLAAAHHPGSLSVAFGLRERLLKVTNLLSIVHSANLVAGEPIPFSRFGNKNVGKTMDWQHEYLYWRAHTPEARALCGLPPHHKTVHSFCEFPCVLNPDTKSKIIQKEANFQKHQKVQESYMKALAEGIPPGLVTFLEVYIRRDHIVKDTLDQIKLGSQDLKKPLKVTFISNEMNEEGQDAGGLSKEFFQLLVHELFQEGYNLFNYDESTRTFWFNSNSIESHETFQLVGIILGLAIYNNIILDVHFSSAVYKCLLGQNLGFPDLEAAMPELAKGLQQMLEYEGDVESVFCTTFEVEYDYFGEMRTHELKPGGGDIPVTNDNCEEYVRLYTQFTMVDSVKDQMVPFREGFSEMLNGPALSLFRHEELELLVCGLPHFDFSSLRAGAQYEGGYSNDHEVVQWFWEVLEEMPLDKKKRFLAFTTGCDRAPIGGLSELTLKIQKSGPDTSRLPSSHTCFNTLLLPEYSSKAKLADRLMLAIENAVGFGLQ